jgi:hypothetical protein
MWDDQSRVASYEAVAKGHTTQGIIPNTVASLPIYIVDIVPNQCAHERVLSLSSVWTLFGRSLHVTGVTSSIPEDDLAAVMLQSALGRFFFVFTSFFLTQQDVSVDVCQKDTLQHIRSITGSVRIHSITHSSLRTVVY